MTTEHISPDRRREALRALLRDRARRSAEPQPASQGQQALWTFHQLHPDSPAYNLSFAARVEGPLDNGALRTALQQIVEHHAGLRTTLIEINGEVSQRISQQGSLEFGASDMTGLTAEEVDAAVTQFCTRPFDLAGGPLLRVRTIRRADENLLLLSAHHVAMDLWSFGLFMDDLKRCYPAAAAGRQAELARSGQGYLDYVRWQAETLRGEKGAADAAYWADRLAGAVPVLDLPTDRPRPAVPSHLGAVHTFRLGPEMTGRARALATERRTTPYVVLLAAFQLLMHRWTGQDDVCVGSVSSGRSRAAFQDVMGYFSNLTVLRTYIGRQQSFDQLVDEVRENALGALEHQDHPFPLVAERLSGHRRGGGSPLFNVAFYYESASWSAQSGLSLFGTGFTDAHLELGDLTLRPYGLSVQGTEHDLSLFIEEVDGDLCCSLRYATDLFDPSTAKRLAESFASLTAECLAFPGRDHALLRAVPDTDQQLLQQWNRLAEGAKSSDRCAHHLVLEQAERTPDALAVVHADRSLTYRELVRRATDLAAELQSRGVGPDVRVGLSAEGSLELIVGMLAVLLAGGAYVPLDPAYPHDRLTYMLDNCQAALLLTLRRHAGQLPPTDLPVVFLDELRPASGGRLTGPAAGPDDLAYVIYTSGTTGRPKGAMITHQGLVNLDLVHREALPPRPGRRVLQFASISFDYFTWEWMLALTTGGSLHLATREELRPGPPLIGLVARDRITTLNLTAGVLSTLDPSDLPSVTEVTSASEPCSAALVERWARDGRRMVNAYGPTEISVFCTTMAPLVADGSTPPIGRTVPGTELHVLDENLQPVPIGAVGELYIGGLGVGRGYQSRPDITADRFVPDPFSTEPGQRLYRSGDRVRWDGSGVLHYLGRNDHQVKIRGVRIEPSEVETVLADHPAVRRAVVLARPSRAGDLHLVGYVTLREGIAHTVDGAALRTYVAETLPAAMVPAFVVVLDRFPLNPNGKLDRERLPEPDLERAAETLAGGEPRTPVERDIAEIWSEVLGVQRVGIRENFFELGGHSLLATRVAARLRDVLGVELPLRELFEARTIESLAERVQHQVAALDGDGRSEGPGGAIEAAPRDERGTELSFAQRRLWFLEQLQPGDPAYHVAGELHLHGELDVTALRTAMTEVVRRHEALRTVFTATAGEPRQVVAPVPDDVMPLSELTDAQELAKRSAAFAAEPFDLTRAPMRAALVRLGATRHVLLLALHHIVSDGWSMRILLRELGALYAAFAAGRPSPLPEPGVQYADFTVWQRQRHSAPEAAAALAHWQRRLAGSPPALELPTDFPRGELSGRTAGSAAHSLGTELTAALTELATRHGATPSMVLLAAFNLLLSRWSGQQEVLVGMPVAGRVRREVEDTIGLFVNTVVIRTDISGAPSFTELLARVRRTALDADAHQDVPFEELVERLAPRRDMSRTPVFQVMFNMHNLDDFEAELPGLRTRLVEARDTTSKFDLTLYAKPRDGRIDLELVYSADLFADDSMRALLDQLCALLVQAVADPDRPIETLRADGLPAGSTRPAAETPALPVAVPWSGAVHEKFLRAARRTPDSVALLHSAGSLSYAELERRSAALAERLQAAGVSRGDRVAVRSARCAGLAVALLGTLRVGAAFAVLDRSHPAARQSVTARKVAARVWVEVGGNGDAPEVPGPRPATVLHIESDGTVPAASAEAFADPSARPEDTAYIAFTSGSTGVPKAVVGPHGPLAHFVDWYARTFAVGPQDRFALTSGLSHDPLLRDLFVPLALGAPVGIPSPEQLAAPETLAAWLADNEVTVLHLTPPMVRFLAGLPKGCLPALRYAFFGGDVLTAHEVQVMRRLAPGVTVVNFYGTTETPQAHAYHIVGDHPAGQQPLGRGIDGSELLVLRGTERAAVGELGEIAVRSTHLADGYLDDQEATARAFTTGRHTGPGERLYRTGDLGRLRADGTVMFAGRADRQFKVRGYRVEPAEAEAVLRTHPGVGDVRILAGTDSGGETVLHAYVVAGGDDAPGLDAGVIRAYAAQRLPEYLVPTTVSVIDGLPLTPNGKVDERALRDLRADRTDRVTAPGTAPTPGLEQRLAELWRGLLQIDHVGREDNFFDLGGHSLLVVRLQALLEGELRRTLTVVELFRHPTVAALAKALGDDEQDTARRAHDAAEKAAYRNDRRAQRRRRLREEHSGGHHA
ncbi:non-ribosomal peptide synthetase [Streptomyces caatingaensis]|uniref:non-ribosomal peptide synthetase n=1 Tax=Streptomyces caatingaensis TaxID=1678637 RepID=UPI0006728653|nr:non-ribosomal peptide synthetase [Streptomyces caatingaensis]